jgi:hypothetical protein
MKNLKFGFGKKLTKDEMRKITGGVVDPTGYCVYCTDGVAEYLECNGHPSDCAAEADEDYRNGVNQGYACSSGASNGQMELCPL